MIVLIFCFYLLRNLKKNFLIFIRKILKSFKLLGVITIIKTIRSFIYKMNFQPTLSHK